MLRLLVVAEDDTSQRLMVRRARAALEEMTSGDAAEIVVSPRGTGLHPVARLDAGLFTRPLPDRLLVVGSDPSCSPAEMAFLDTVLDLRPELSAATLDPVLSIDVESLLALGGIFRGGPLCQAGGFAGDGRRSIADRLAAMGFASAVLPGAPPVDIRPRPAGRWWHEPHRPRQAARAGPPPPRGPRRPRPRTGRIRAPRPARRRAPAAHGVDARWHRGGARGAGRGRRRRRRHPAGRRRGPREPEDVHEVVDVLVAAGAASLERLRHRSRYPVPTDLLVQHLPSHVGTLQGTDFALWWNMVEAAAFRASGLRLPLPDTGRPGRPHALAFGAFHATSTILRFTARRQWRPPATLLGDLAEVG